MKIAFIGGTGNLGYGLALRCAAAGETVLIGSRSVEKAQEAADRLNAELGAIAQPVAGMENGAAAADAELVVISLPFAAHEGTLPAIAAACEGKVVLDTTVPMQYGKPPVYIVPESGSAAEGVQKMLPGAKVVSGLQTVSAASLAEKDRALACDALICGDDDEAKQLVIEVFSRFIPRIFDAGALSQAQALERLTPLFIALNQKYKRKHIGLQLSNI
ncbi:MAG: NADPH-dependent F420 reductase [Clostridia bacterium]|nr:NADPH-dependent F420 reductase [Clostridia bacterium]